MSVPNQKRIIIERTSDKATKDYLKISHTNLYLAMYNLDSKSFMLWLYFVDNANGHILELYPVDFTTKTGLSRATYDRAFKELEEMGYLIKSDNNKNLYWFKEESTSNKIKQVDEVWSLSNKSLEDMKKQYFSQIE